MLAALTAVGFLLLLREMGADWTAALVLAAVFPFGTFFSLNVVHLQLHSAGLLLTGLFCLLRTIRTQNPWWLAGSALSWLVLLLSSVYLALFFPLAAMLTLCCARGGASSMLSAARKAVVSPAALVLLACIACAGMIAATYRVLDREIGIATREQDLDRFDLDIEGYLLPVGGQGFTSRLYSRSQSPEGNLYLGWTVLISLTLSSLFARSRCRAAPRVRWAADTSIGLDVMILALVVLAMGRAVTPRVLLPFGTACFFFAIA